MIIKNFHDMKRVKNAMRALFMQSKTFSEFLGRSVHGKDGRRNVYKCTRCGFLYARQSIQVNHIKPLMNAKNNFMEWMELLWDDGNLEIVCEDCHIDITEEQKREMAEMERSGNLSEKRRVANQ